MGQYDPFALLGLPHRFDLEPDAIETTYLQLLAACHPDRLEPGIARAEAVGDSARLNQARMTLLDPESRANTLHALLGGPVAREDESLPEGFLEDMLSIRMEMESVLAGEDEGERERMREWATAQRTDFITDLSDTFAGLTSPPDPEELRSIRVQLNTWRYIERMIEQLDPVDSTLP